MTQGFLEAISTATGDQLTALSGFRSTRLTSITTPETQVIDGVLSATSTDGINVTLSSDTFSPAVIGQRFRLQTGPRYGENTTIANVISTTHIVLNTNLGSFFNESWVIVQDADTTLSVETTLNWPTSGQIYLDGIKYSYTGTTLTSFTGLSWSNPTHPRGSIQVVSGSSINDGETVTINDGYGTTIIFEFDSNSSVVGGHVAIPFTALDTALTVRDSVINTIKSTKLLVFPYAMATTLIELTHEREGTKGNVTISSTVANAGFIVTGMYLGQDTQAGVAMTHQPLSEVIDYNRNYSSLDILRRSFLVDYATGEDLNIIGRNYGIDRPPTLLDDSIYRNIIKSIAYGYRGTKTIMEQILTAVLGSNWEIFEDFTSGFANEPDGASDFPVGPSNHNNTVFFRRTNGQELQSVGKAYLDGTVTLPSSTTTTLTLPTGGGNIIGKVASVHLADDFYPLRFQSRTGLTTGKGRVIAFGGVGLSTGISSTDLGVTITASGTPFNSAVLFAGDVIEILSGPAKGLLGTVRVVNSTSSISTGFVEGSPLFTINKSFSNADWQVWRSTSNFRLHLPSEEVYLEFPTDTGTTPWLLATGGSGSASLVAPSGTDSGYTRLVAPSGANNANYAHTFRGDSSSYISFEVRVRFNGTVSSTAGDAAQYFFGIQDGAKQIFIGVLGTSTPGQYNIGFVDGTGNLITPPTLTTISGGAQWLNLLLEKHGTNNIDFFIEGTPVQTIQYSNISIPASSSQNIIFGVQGNSSGTLEIDIKSADWHVHTDRDYNNTRITAGSSTAPNTLTDTASGNWVQPGDVGKFVRVLDFSGVNGTSGNARGEWQIATAPTTNSVTVVGQTQGGATFQGSFFPNRLVIEGDPYAFTWPDNKQFSIAIEDGPNTGTYAIDKFLAVKYFSDSSTILAFEDQYPTSASFLINATSAALVPFVEHTNMIQIIGNFPVPTDPVPRKWHLIPAFPNSISNTVVFEICDTSTLNHSTGLVTLRQPLPVSPVLIEAEFTTVLSGQVSDSTATNSVASSVYHLYPFYLQDRWGYVRDLIDVVRAAGVYPDFDSLFRNPAPNDNGPHIIGE